MSQKRVRYGGKERDMEEARRARKRDGGARSERERYGGCKIK